jgi:hypothetical protein
LGAVALGQLPRHFSPYAVGSASNHYKFHSCRRML